MSDLDVVTPALAGERDLTAGDAAVGMRTAVASGRVVLGAGCVDQIRSGMVPKGNVLEQARVAGTLAAKQTSHLIPSSHGVLLAGIELDFELDDSSVHIRAYVKTLGTAGVGMEALTAVSVAALTIVDMCKTLAREATITDVHLVARTGGQSGSYRRPD